MKSKHMWMAAFLVLFGSVAAACAQPVRANGDELKFVVILMRHGVRPPLWTAEQLNQYSSDPWPKWDVPAGNLTSHGAQLIGLLGTWHRTQFQKAGLLSAAACADAGRIHIRADTDQRTIATGRAFADGLLPGCNVQIDSLKEGEADPIFSPLKAGLGKPDRETAAAAISGRIGGHPEALAEAYKPALETLQYILLGCRPGPKCAVSGKQSLLDLPSAVEPGKSDRPADVRGPLATASTLSENFLLEYTNGMEGKDLGWGRLTEANLRQVMALHIAYSDLARRTPYIGRILGSNLLSHVLKSMEQAVTGKAVPGALGKPGDRALVLVGHDGNISNIAGMLDVTWAIPSYQPNDTPPGGALIFELWCDSRGAYSVRTRYTTQTLEQMRKARPLTAEAPPASAPLFLLGCSTAGPGMPCAWMAFKDKLEAAIDPAFVK